MSRKQQGVAVITALLVVALVTAVTGFLAWRQQLWLRTVENQLNMAQARGIARAAMNLVRAELHGDRTRGGKLFDHPGEAWAVPIQSIPVEQGSAGGVVRDLQGRFNLNNLVDEGGNVNEQGLAAFRRLLALLQLPPELAASLLDWEDGDGEPVSGGAEDGHYLGQQPPYRAANRPLQELNNLYRVRGFSPEVVARLAPYVCVLPRPAPVNVNFVSTTVLQALLPELPADVVAGVVGKARDTPYETLEQLRQDLPETLRDQVVESLIDVRTSYFEAVTHARFGNVTVSLTAMLSRTDQGFPQIVWMRRSDLSEQMKRP